MKPQSSPSDQTKLSGQFPQDARARRAPRPPTMEAPPKRKVVVPDLRGGVAPDLQRRARPVPAFAATSLGSLPNFAYRGGPVIQAPRVQACFWGAGWADAAHQERAARLTDFLVDVVQSDFMNVLSQYGVGRGTFHGSSFLDTVAAILTDADVQTLLENEIAAGNVPRPGTPSSICYIVFLDENSGVQDPKQGLVMCEATGDTAFGYHSFFQSAEGPMVYYAVVPGLDTNCVTESCPGGNAGCSLQTTQTQIQRLTQVVSHEFAEMTSDPRISAWFDSGAAGENGDACNGNSANLVVGQNTWNVQRIYSKFDDVVNGNTCIPADAAPTPALVQGFGHGINDGRPFWVGDFTGDGSADVLFYYPGDDNWWLGTSNKALLVWSFAGNTAGFGHGINDGRPFWVGRFSQAARDEILFYYPGDDNWWLGSYDGNQLAWRLAGNTAGFGHGINDGRPFWIGDINGDGRDEVLFYYPGDDNWWLGTWDGNQLAWSFAGNTAGFGHGINDGRPFWVGRFSQAARDEILFYYPGDDNWWLGTYDGVQLVWSFAGNTAGFGHSIADGRPFYVSDFDGDGKSEIDFYYPGDDNWWIGAHDGNQIAWGWQSNTGGYPAS
jgi:hypothetical protein